MKKEISKTQQEIIDSIINEFANINVKEVKANKKSPFDVSDIVSDVKAKQKAMDENEVLRKIFEKAIFAQMDVDVKKLNKILKPIGFFVETYDQKEVRCNRKKQYYPAISIVHTANRFQVNFDSYEEHFDIKYDMIFDNSKRADLKTPIGFELELHGRCYEHRNRTKTIEEAFVIPALKNWIKQQYENATIRKAA
jgi:hypothetical protein